MSSGLANLSTALNVSGSFPPVQPVSVSVEKDKESLWYFTSEQLTNSPSRRHGIDIDQELSYRQMTAYLIQEMGQRLQVSQLCINTAIVYMHRFYAFHSFTHFHRNGIAAASLFLAAKVEEQPRKLEHVIKAANKCLNQPTSSTTDAYYLDQAQDLVFNENVLLQTLGFDVAIDHPHTHVVKTCHLVKACKDLAQTSYFLASNSLHLTSMCLQYKPTVVACFCIYLACKWSRWEIPQSTEGKHWFHYVDKTVTMDLLKQLTDEFIAIYEKSPARLKSKLNSIKALAQGASNRVVNKDKKAKPEEWKMVDMMKMYHSSINTNEPNNASSVSNSLSLSSTSDQPHQHSGQAPLLPPPHSHQQIRRPESHSSQHRTHHSSSTSHHHQKQTLFSNDVPDQKANGSGHKQAHNSSGNRPRDHTQYSQNLNAISIIQSSSSSASRSNVPSGNNNSNRPVLSCGVTSQKLSSQSHEPNYHKSRDRNSLPAPSNSSATLLQAHKLQPKAELGRIITKEHIGRLADQNKSSNSKAFASLNAPQSGSTQLLSGTDISRNIVQQHQRLPSSGYHQSTSSRTNNSKLDQSLPVQIQLTQQKHPLGLEPQFGSSSSEFLQSGLAVPSNTHSIARQADSMQSGDEHNSESSQTYSSLLPFQGFKSQPQPQSKLSMFSPELSETIPQHQQQLVSANNSKKSERERSLGTPTKKDRDRSRTSFPVIDGTNQMVAPIRASAQPTQKLPLQKRLDTSTVTNILAGPSTSSYAGVKRQNDNAPILQDEELNRDVKMRKLDTSSINIIGQSFSETRTGPDANKIQIVNGIETNPDLVRTLLKESLCTTNALIKTEPPSAANILPPTQLLEPSNALIKVEKVSAPTSMQASMEADETAGGKLEKKKKKDKHKHKEKDKSKDRDERRKHKKDKERHKERELDTSEPVKIKILKEKLEASNNSGGEAMGFKIKIPKDRIIGDLNISGNSNNYGSATVDNNKSMNVSSPPALKIKISKDKLENYSSGSSDSATPAFNTLNNQTFINNNLQGGAAVSNSSSRKKDRERDREREKEKKRNSFETMKSNTNGSGVPVAGNPYVQSTSCSKNASSSKIQHYNNNMSQLFGESNDDDDDEVIPYQRPKKSSLLKTAISAFPSTQNFHSSSKPSIEMELINKGSFNLQQQQQQQYQSHQLTHLQRQNYKKKY